MTSQQITLIKKSWNLFQPIDPVLVGDVFYSKLFLDMPKLKSMFHIGMDEQGKKLVDMLNVIVGRLDRPDELTEDIKQLAIRHVRYGVRPVHYKAVGDALLWTLKNGLGKDWNNEVAAAWNTCYQSLSNTMIDSAGYKAK